MIKYKQAFRQVAINNAHLVLRAVIIALKLMSVVKLLWQGIIITEDIKVILHWPSSGLSMDGTTGNIVLGSVTKAAH